MWAARLTAALSMGLLLLAVFSAGALGSGDTAAPVVTWTGPTGDYYIPGGSSHVVVTGTVTDPEPSSGLSYAYVSTDTGDGHGCAIAGNNITCDSWSCEWTDEDYEWNDEWCGSEGYHTGTIHVKDNAGHWGTATGSFTIIFGSPPPPPPQIRPSLGLGSVSPYWASMADYIAGKLTVGMTVTNFGDIDAFDVALTGATNTNGVTLYSVPPVAVGDIAAGADAMTALEYIVPAGVSAFTTSITAAASDVYGVGYTYP
jgi:hypothetical protein